MKKKRKPHLEIQRMRAITLGKFYLLRDKLIFFLILTFFLVMIFVLFATFKVENIFLVILVNFSFIKNVVNILQNPQKWILGIARNVLRM